MARKLTKSEIRKKIVHVEGSLDVAVRSTLDWAQSAHRFQEQLLGLKRQLKAK